MNVLTARQMTTHIWTWIGIRKQRGTSLAVQWLKLSIPLQGHGFQFPGPGIKIPCTWQDERKAMELTTLLYARANSKSFITRKIFIKNFLPAWHDGLLLNLLWSFHMMYVNKIIMLYTLNLYSAICQLYINKTGRKRSQKYG